MYLRIERHVSKPGAKRIAVRSDRFFVVDGEEELEISELVRGLKWEPTAGKTDEVWVDILAFMITEVYGDEDGTPAIIGPEPPDREHGATVVELRSYRSRATRR